MRLPWPDQAELAEIAQRTLAPATRDPDGADLITLYLFLPVDLPGPPGFSIRCRSSLDALLGDSYRVTGRNGEGDVVDEGSLGTWLGAMGFLALFDQIGKAIRWSNRPIERTRHPFESILLQHGGPTITSADAAALYALRNAMVHSYGLANQNKKRPEYQRFFTLEPWGGWPLVRHPETPWTGDPHDVDGMVTVVRMQALGNLAETLVLDLCETWIKQRRAERDGQEVTDGLSITKRLNPAEMRRRYFFRHRVPID